MAVEVFGGGVGCADVPRMVGTNAVRWGQTRPNIGLF